MKMLISKIEKLNNEQEEINQKDTQKEIEDLKRNWFEKQNKLSFFIEHNELEKVTESLMLMEENIKNKEYTMALQECKEFLYWVQHFEEKDKLKLKNIF